MAQDKEVTADVNKPKASVKRAKATVAGTTSDKTAAKSAPAKKAPAKKTVAAKKVPAKTTKAAAKNATKTNSSTTQKEVPHAAFAKKESEPQGGDKSKDDSIGGAFEHAYQEFEESFSDFVEKSRVNLKEWNKLMMSTNEVILEKVSEKSKELYDYASKKPVSALLVSVGVGAALYKAFKRR